MKQVVSEKMKTVAGIDVGTECIKVIVMDANRGITGRSVMSTGGNFRDRTHEALTAAVEEAKTQASDLARVCTTGFGASCAPIDS